MGMDSSDARRSASSGTSSQSRDSDVDRVRRLHARHFGVAIRLCYLVSYSPFIFYITLGDRLSSGPYVYSVAFSIMFVLMLLLFHSYLAMLMPRRDDFVYMMLLRAADAFTIAAALFLVTSYVMYFL